MTLEQLPLIMLRALVLTAAVECAVAWLIGVRDKRGQSVVVLVNLLTNPLVVSIGAAVLYFAGPGALLTVTLVMEVIVVAVEGMVYHKMAVNVRNPFLISLICNLSSYVAGELLNRFVF